MKKILAILLATAIICMGVVVSFAESTFNCFIDSGGEVSVAAGNPSTLSATSFEVGLGTADVSVRGWLMVEMGVKSFKYSVDGGDYQPIEVMQGARQDVLNAFPSYDAELNATPGVNVTIPLEGLAAGEHEFIIAFVDNEDDEYDFYQVDVTIVAGGEVADPLTERVGYSFDVVKYDDNEMVSSMAGNWLAANYPDGEIDAAAENFSVFWIYGWVGYKGEIESFGYKLGEEITYGDFA
ncbi:MAG: hypothetical protein J5912_08635 [Clostridia bacterium]|nr:hypothetical protein [Clostridia bacterium]